MLYGKYFSIVGGWCCVCLQNHRDCCSAEPAYDSCSYGPVPPIDTNAVGVFGSMDIQSSSSVSYPLPLIPDDVLEIFAYSLILSFSLIFTVMNHSAEGLNGLIEIILSIPSLPVETRQDYRQVYAIPL